MTTPAGELRDTYRNTTRFFESVADRPHRSDVSIVVVAHVLRGTLPYIDGLARLAPVASVLAKPRSIHPDELALIATRYRVTTLDREQFLDPDHVVRLLDEAVTTDSFVIVDIGGYFAAHIDVILRRCSARLVGVVEDTENGLRRYIQRPDVLVPLVSVARSDIKASEDYLVGQWIVFSTEALMREFGSILNGRLAVVIGYGRIGRSIAHHLQMRGVTTTVVEIDPVRAIEAKAHGFILLDKRRAVGRGNVIFCATGSHSLAGEDFLDVRSGSYISSVTSSDDELDLTYARQTYDVRPLTENIERFDRSGQFFYLLNQGNAVNFVHRGGLGPFILPVQGEIVAAVGALLEGRINPGLNELDSGDRRAVATKWLHVFRTVNAE